MMADEKIRLVTENIKSEIAAAESRILEIVQKEIRRSDPLGPEGGALDAGALVGTAKQIVNVRRLRRKFFPSELFHERAWDMLLELFISHTEHRDVWVKSLLGAADGSPTTAIRWLDHLEASGLILRRADEADRRRVIVNLTPEGEAAMGSYLQEARSTM